MSVIFLNQSVATNTELAVTFVAAVLALFIISAAHGAANFDVIFQVASWAVALAESA
jgi:hypothetical protein